MDIKDIINRPLADLHIGQEFEQKSEAMGFRTLKDVLLLMPKDLIARQGFSYLWLGDLIRFLSENKMLHLLQPLPGQERIDVSTL